MIFYIVGITQMCHVQCIFIYFENNNAHRIYFFLKIVVAGLTFTIILQSYPESFARKILPIFSF